MAEYVPVEIEAKWQKSWEESGSFEPDFETEKSRYYMLTMLPYPSGDLHIGHWYAMAPSDTYARFLKMQGNEVFFPIGFDAFGLPAENAAIKNNIHPKDWTYKNIERMRLQLRSMGNMFAWKNEVVSCDPDHRKRPHFSRRTYYPSNEAGDASAQCFCRSSLWDGCCS